MTRSPDALCAAGERPTAFDAIAFMADLRAAGCRVVVSTPGTRFEPSDEVPTYFIRPALGYPAVMARWHDALAACPDHVGVVVAHLTAANGWEA